jgi:hypothetical protein
VIVLLRGELFEGEETDDLALLRIFDEGRGRYKVRTKPAYRPRSETTFHRWLTRQTPRVQDQIRIVLERGLKETEFDIPGGEPTIIVERRSAPAWPDNLAKGQVKLPLDKASDLLKRPLRLLLENGRNDWGFLNKVVPSDWRERWDRAIEGRWIEQENGGGITEMRKIIEHQISLDHARRVLTWVMFDCDGSKPGESSDDSRKARDACEQWCVAHHALVRRAIENYIPEETLREWARRRTRADRKEMQQRVEAYVAMREEERHYYNLKAGIHGDLAQDIWGEDPDKNPYVVKESALDKDGSGPERTRMLQSIFSLL